MQTARTTPAKTSIASISELGSRESVIKALAYFDIFEYPLTADEIAQFMDQQLSDDELNQVLARLLGNKTIFRHQDLYSLRNNPQLVQRRRDGNEMAGRILRKAHRIGNFLQRFPFVRAIGISGSLSKNYAEKSGDIDFFIITTADRLWIARTLMHLFKKITFLFGRQHFYCMNYYLDEKALELSQQNIFTAIEARTVVPVTGGAVMQNFATANEWVNEWLPSCPIRLQQEPDKQPGFIKRLIEKTLSGSFGSRIDDFLLKWTNRRWTRKEKRGKKNNKGQRMGLITGKHFAISNPGGFQEKVLAAYEQKLSDLGVRPHPPTRRGSCPHEPQ